MKTTLTKTMLEEMGINIQQVSDNEYLITRTITLGTFKKKNYIHKLSLIDVVCKHPYGKDKSYPAIGFSYHCKPKIIILSRLLYAWFKGDAPADMDVSHINDDAYDNRLENLVLLTHKENIKMRQYSGANQFKNSVTKENK